MISSFVANAIKDGSFKVAVSNLKDFTKVHSYKDLADGEDRVYICLIQLQKLLLLVFPPLPLPPVPILF